MNFSDYLRMISRGIQLNATVCIVAGQQSLAAHEFSLYVFWTAAFALLAGGVAVIWIETGVI